MLRSLSFICCFVALISATSSAYAWQVTREKDQMTDASTVRACLKSSNTVTQAFPYSRGPTFAELCLSTKGNGKSAFIVVNQGQVQCNSFSSSVMTVRPDDESAKTLECTSAASGRTEFGFFNDEDETFAVIFSAKNLIRVQVPLYQFGLAVFRFNVGGLKLPRELAEIGRQQVLPERGQSTQSQEGSAYGLRAAAAVRRNIVFQMPADLEGNPRVVFQVQLRPDCGLAGVRLRRSSGVPAWDQAAERGIQRTDPFPRPSDGACRSEVEITLVPLDAR